MKWKQKPARSILSATIITMMSSQSVHSGAFQLYTEGSAAAIGNYAAGIAAEASDASTAWYNPAGLVLLKKQQVVVSGVGVFPSAKLTGTSTYDTDGDPPYIQSFNNLQGAEDALVPAFYYVKPLGERAAFGLSVVSPFGLSTSWTPSSPLRYSATSTRLTTINLSPELAGQLTDHVSLGLGLDLQYAKVKFNGVIGSPADLQYLSSFSEDGLPLPRTLDSISFNQGNSYAVGFHAGLLGRFNDNHTRLGVNYQSGTSHQFYGASVLIGPLAAENVELDSSPSSVFRTNMLSSNTIHLPDVLTLSAYQDMNSKIALLASAVYTGWSSFKQLQLNNIAASSAETGMHALINSSTVEDYRDVWRFALGANYHVTDKWMMRVGGGYDQTPTIDAQRDIRLPDSNRWALSIGSHYQPRSNVGVDIGYSYLFATNNPPINKTLVLNEANSTTVNAIAKVHVQLVGLQVVWNFDKPISNYVEK